jgi:hypothetical protein
MLTSPPKDDLIKPRNPFSKVPIIELDRADGTTLTIYGSLDRVCEALNNELIDLQKAERFVVS